MPVCFHILAEREVLGEYLKKVRDETKQFQLKFSMSSLLQQERTADALVRFDL